MHVAGWLGGAPQQLGQHLTLLAQRLVLLVELPVSLIGGLAHLLQAPPNQAALRSTHHERDEDLRDLRPDG